MKKAKNTFDVNGNEIPWSFFHLVAKKYGMERAKHVFWMARNKRNIMGYISSGIKNRWFSINTVELDRNKSACEAWCLDTFDRKIPKEKPRSGKQKVESLSSIIGRIV